MIKGFKFVETIPFECDGNICITPCPHNVENIFGIRKVGSYSCVVCEYFSSRTNKSVNCLYDYKSKKEKESE